MAQFTYHLHHYHKKMKQRKKNSTGAYLMVFFAMLGPLMTIPQVQQSLISHHVQGLSLFTWGSYTVASLIWAGYGFLHAEPPIYLSSIVGFLVNALVVVAIVMYH